MRGLERAVVEQHSVVGQDTDLVSPKIRIAAHQRGAIRRLIFVKATAVDDSRDHLALGSLLWTLWAGHDVARDRDRLFLAVRGIIRGAADPRMEIASAEFVGA